MFQSRFEVSQDVFYFPPTPTGWKYVSPPPSLFNMATISCPLLLWRVFISCKLLQNITFQRKEASINYIFFIRLIFRLQQGTAGLPYQQTLRARSKHCSLGLSWWWNILGTGSATERAEGTQLWTSLETIGALLRGYRWGSFTCVIYQHRSEKSHGDNCAWTSSDNLIVPYHSVICKPVTPEN